MTLEDSDYTKILEAGWFLERALWDRQSEYEKGFIGLELSGMRTREYYLRRVDQVGFRKLDRVLDVGCGLGQWTSMLAKNNGSCFGLDLNEGRLEVAKQLYGLTEGVEANLVRGSAENLPFDSGQFDGVFCYGVFMFTNMPKTLSEFRRVLKPGGRLYLNANSWGWYANLIINRGILVKNLRLVRTALEMVFRYMAGGDQNMLVTENYLRRLLSRYDFEIIDLAVEGGLDLSDNRRPKVKSAYPGRYYGMRSILEVLSIRK